MRTSNQRWGDLCHVRWGRGVQKGVIAQFLKCGYDGCVMRQERWLKRSCAMEAEGKVVDGASEFIEQG